MKAKLPPMRPRVTVTDHVVDPTRRAGLLECLATLHFSGVLDAVRAHIRLAQGALVQQARVLPASTKRAAAFGLQAFASLESAAAGASMWLAMREAGAENILAMEEAQTRVVQVLMDVVHEADWAFDLDARVAVAGLGGGGAWWSNRSWVTSGFEEAVNLANDVRLVVLGVVENPFDVFLPEAGRSVREWNETPGARHRARIAGNADLLSTKKPVGATWLTLVPVNRALQRAARLQVNREKPARPEDTDPRDVAILRAMKRGLTGKQVAPATAEFGPPSCQSHVDKRRRDLVKWGWVTRGRDSRLTAVGERWLAEIPDEELRQPGIAR